MPVVSRRFPAFRDWLFFVTVPHMNNLDESSKEDEKIQRRVEMLRPLHPGYSDEELRQAYENLIHYFEMVWRFYERMLRDGSLDRLFDNTSKPTYASEAKVEPKSTNH